MSGGSRARFVCAIEFSVVLFACLWAVVSDKDAQGNEHGGNRRQRLGKWAVWECVQGTWRVRAGSICVEGGYEDGEIDRQLDVMTLRFVDENRDGSWLVETVAMTEFQTAMRQSFESMVQLGSTRWPLH